MKSEVPKLPARYALQRFPHQRFRLVQVAGVLARGGHEKHRGTVVRVDLQQPAPGFFLCDASVFQVSKNFELLLEKGLREHLVSGYTAGTV